MSAYLTDDDSIQIFLIPFELFGLASGSTLNKDKSKIVAAGIWKRRPPDKIYNIPVVPEQKILGAKVLSNHPLTADWDKILQKYKTH